MPLLAAVILVVGWVLQGPASPAGAASAGPERTVALDQNTNSAPDVAFDGTNHLVVWTRGSGNFADVVGARVATDGTVLDPGLIPIAAVPNTAQRDPAVDFDGEVFQVVWEDNRGGSPDIYTARVSTTGAVLDAVGTPVTNLAGDEYDPAIASSPNADPRFGPGSLVVWTDTRNVPSGGGLDVYGARVWRNNILNPIGYQLSRSPGDDYRPDVAVAGVARRFLVAWTSTSLDPAGDIWGTRFWWELNGVVDPGGVPIGAAPGSQVYPDVASDGTAALVVWQDRRAGVADDVYATRWGAEGGALDAGGIPVSTAPGGQSGPQVAWNGSYLVAWADYRNAAVANAYGARVTTAGSVSDPNGIPIGTRQSDLVAAARGGGNTWAVAYSSTGGSGVYLRAVNPK